jgi:uncharacterized membrane protein YjfL (UPF0719 family)
VEQAFQLNHVISALVYSGIGIAILTATFFIFDMITPGNMWKEIVEEKSMPLAICLAAMTIAVGMIIASAIHG